MKNPIMPFVLIMVIGVAAMFLMSFKGLGDMKEIAEGKEEVVEEQPGGVAASPEELYQSKSCIACHGGDYKGTGMAPQLIGVGEKLSQEEIIDIIVNGVAGTTMPGLISAEEAPQMAEWLANLK